MSELRLLTADLYCTDHGCSVADLLLKAGPESCSGMSMSPPEPTHPEHTQKSQSTYCGLIPTMAHYIYLYLTEKNISIAWPARYNCHCSGLKRQLTFLAETSSPYTLPYNAASAHLDAS